MEINNLNDTNKLNQSLQQQNLANNSGMGKDSPI